MKKKLAVFYVLLTSLCLLTFASLLLHSLGYRVNLSESLPGHIYRVIPLEGRDPIERGDRVLIDLSRFYNPVIELGITRGYVSRSRRMLKEIGAVPGDTVELRDALLFVNGVSTPMVISSEDSRGSPLRAYPTPLVLPPDRYWLVSVPYRGFDSRYFGPINRSAFTHRAELIL
ncbi:MAG: S26 family signal peptidase [Synergistaceae bacterium]|nr:S26 family signal peptidase [Synergistaceae bacterium]